MNFTRRQFLKSSAIAGGVLAVGGIGSLIKPRTAYAMANSPSLQKWKWRDAYIRAARREISLS